MGFIKPCPQKLSCVRKFFFNLYSKFKQGDALLNNQLDKLAVNFQTGNPQFYNKYQNARIIVNLGGKGGDKEPLQPTPPPQ